MKPSPFRLLAASERSRIAAAAGEAFARWMSDWFGSGAEAGVEARPASEARPGSDDAAPLARAADGARWVAVLAGQGAWRAAAARFAAQAGDTWSARGELPPVLRGAVEECFTALADELLALARVHAAARGAEVELEAAWRHGSGAAAVAGDLDGEHVEAVLSPGLVSELVGAGRPPPRGGLARRMDCIQDRRVGLRVMAGSADLGIGSLISIAPGDVIVLDARIDQTFALTGAGGAPLGRGFLGASGGSKALQLVSQDR
jgi:flagellar motor switch protein FliM/N